MILDVVHSQERAQLDGLNQFDGALHGHTQPSGKGGGGGRILIVGDLNYNIKCYFHFVQRCFVCCYSG